MIPEYISSLHVHEVLEPRNIEIISPGTIRLFHLRQVSIYLYQLRNVMKEVDECRDNLVSRRNETCISPYRCMLGLKTINMTEWVIASNTWIVL
ncbi:unnamed protein product [Gongylonema pulchrum]|uniref:Uncharacterized protein n=1 Tax=Gongylonema pulchrum TaxID=637853 RepID=A0A183E7P6_9BILA|nr:unnamed protein product [Gongylonema pulchrum]